MIYNDVKLHSDSPTAVVVAPIMNLYNAILAGKEGWKTLISVPNVFLCVISYDSVNHETKTYFRHLYFLVWWLLGHSLLLQKNKTKQKHLQAYSGSLTLADRKNASLSSAHISLDSVS